MKKKLLLTEIDLTKGRRGDCPGLDTESTYLIKYDNKFFVGSFDKVWFGLTFTGWYAPLQYDTPETNGSRWQRVWKLEEK